MEQVTVTLKHKASKKHSERYDSDDMNAVIKSLYIGKDAFKGGPRPDRVTVTVTG